jgi:hypothetical protein
MSDPPGIVIDMPPRIDSLLEQLASVGDLVDEVTLSVASTPAPALDLDPRMRTDDRLRALLVGLERVRNAAEAAQADVMVALSDEARDLDRAEFAATGAPSRSHGEFVPDEIGILLACTKGAAGRRYGLALRSAQFPPVVRAWRTGEIDARKAQVIVDEVSPLTDVEVLGGLSPQEVSRLTGELAEAGVDHARTHTPSETHAWLRRRIVRLAPEVAELRRGRAEHERRVEIHPADDGMSELWAWLPSVDARQIQQALTSAARDLSATDLRSMDQRRADLLVDWLLGPDHAPTVHLHLASDATTADGVALDTSSWLPGVGQLTELQTSDLLLSARKVVTEVVGPTQREQGYRPSAGLDRAVRTRDVTCRFPGCVRTGLGVDTGTDLDHTVPWPDGPTASSNLAVLCRRHHRLKHAPGWGVVLGSDGLMTWRAPSGRVFVTEPWHFADQLERPPLRE